MEKYRAIPQGYMTVGEIAKKMGVTVRTLQYYHKEGLFTPSAESEGGRRLYTDKDIIRLYQILSLKHLGFSLEDIKNKIRSLDSPTDVARVLAEQAADIKREIQSLSQAYEEIELLKAEVLQMQSVDFKKYADILTNIQMKNEDYWLIKYFDEQTLDYIRNRFDMESGMEFMNKFSFLKDKILDLQKHNVPPDSEAAQSLAKDFWEMIMEITAGNRMNIVMQVNSLQKSYGSKAVLKGITFDIKKGEIFALLGVNGAGKTTTLECIEGLRKYDNGNIMVNGKMGIQLQSSSLPEHIKSMEAVQLFAKWNKAKIDQSMLTALGIGEIAKKQYSQLSTGQKRRLHLALALIGNPDIVFLDEPTAGLDVEGRISLHAQIRKLKEQGKTVILASHDMAEVEMLCDRIAILNGGTIVFLGTIGELNAKVGKHYSIEIETEQGNEFFEVDDIGDKLLSLLENYKQNNISILNVKISRGTLEQHFMEIARGNVE